MYVAYISCGSQCSFCHLQNCMLQSRQTSLLRFGELKMPRYLYSWCIICMLNKSSSISTDVTIIVCFIVTWMWNYKSMIDAVCIWTADEKESGVYCMKLQMHHILCASLKVVLSNVPYLYQLYHAASHNTLHNRVSCYRSCLSNIRMHTITSNPFIPLTNLILFNKTLLIIKCKITTIWEVAVLSQSWQVE